MLVNNRDYLRSIYYVILFAFVNHIIHKTNLCFLFILITFVNYNFTITNLFTPLKMEENEALIVAERMKSFIEYKGISVTQFADATKIQRSSMSQILHFLAKTAVALLLCIAPASVAGYVYMFTANGAAFYALLFVFGLVSFLVQSYFFAQLAVLDIGVGSALKNAFLLLGVEWKCTLKLLATGGLLLVLSVVFTTYMIPFLALCVFSLTALSVSAEVSDVIDRRLIK